MFTPNKDGSVRFSPGLQISKTCCKGGRLLETTHAQNYIDSIREAAIFSTLDESSKNWQIKVENNDPDKMSCTSHEELYRFVQMQPGLRSALSTTNKQFMVCY